MTPAEIARKLEMIRTLPRGELEGWHRYATTYRQPFDGEIAALTARATQLGITLSVRGSA